MTHALLIDDDEALLESLEASAAQAGLTLRTASTWDEGLALFHALSPDLVIADYNLPGSRHGLQLLGEIRRLRPSVRLVLLSGVVGTEELAEVERLRGAHRVLTKGSIETTRAIIEEIAAVAAIAQDKTDWKAFARSYTDAQNVTGQGLDELDITIQESLGE